MFQYILVATTAFLIGGLIAGFVLNKKLELEKKQKP